MTRRALGLPARSRTRGAKPSPAPARRARVYLKALWGSVTDKAGPGAILQAQRRSGMKTGNRKGLQPALSTSGEWRILFAVAVAVAACGGKGGLRFTGDSSQDGVGIPSGGGEAADGLGGSGGGGTGVTDSVTTTGD